MSGVDLRDDAAEGGCGPNRLVFKLITTEGGTRRAGIFDCATQFTSGLSV